MFEAPSFRFIDLFAGIGGFHHALQPLGGDCVLAVEIDPECQVVYGSAFPETPLRGDIRSLTRDATGGDLSLEQVASLVPDHDLLCAGFPCQPFSKSGAQQGLRDRTRGTLFFDVMTIVLAKRPQFVMLENVRNIAGPRHQETWETIIDSLQQAGYRVAREPLVFSPHLLPARLGGAPQVRDRVFILAHRVEGLAMGRRGDLLVDRGPVDGWDPQRWQIEGFLEADDLINGIDRYLLRPEELTWLNAWQAFVQGIEEDVLPGFPIWVDAFTVTPVIPRGTPGWKADFLRKNAAFYREHRAFIDRWLGERWEPLGQTVWEFPASRRKFEWQARRSQGKRNGRDLWKLVVHLRPSGIRVKPASYLPALVAITQTSIIGSRRRRITPREAARLQGLPPDLFERAMVSDKAAYKQLGNAVNVGVVRYLAQVLFRAGEAPWVRGELPQQTVAAADHGPGRAELAAR